MNRMNISKLKVVVFPCSYPIREFETKNFVNLATSKRPGLYTSTSRAINQPQQLLVLNTPFFAQNHSLKTHAFPNVTKNFHGKKNSSSVAHLRDT